MENPSESKSKEHKTQKLEVNSYSRVNDTITIIYGSENAVRKGVEFMNNAQKKMDLCFDSNAPSIVIDVADYRNGYINIRKRGGKIRVITEINNENIEYCRKLMNIVDEMKHLDNIKGGIAINDSEYMATNILHESKPLAQVVYSNVIDVVEQQQNFFNSLWKIAIPAKQKIREIASIEQNHIDVFSALDNKIRRRVILNLAEKNMTASQISKKLNMSLQAFQKHFSKLLESNIVEKNHDGSIYLTSAGRILTKQIPSMQFISENSEYLKRHDLASLPTQFLERIGELLEFETISERNKDEKYAKIIEESKKRIKIIIPQNFNTIFPIQKLLRRKVETRCITDGYIDYSKEIKYYELKEKDVDKNVYFERKITHDVPLILILSERAALLSFKRNDGPFELKNTMYSKDETFIGWCDDLFEHTWKQLK